MPMQFVVVVRHQCVVYEWCLESIVLSVCSGLNSSVLSMYSVSVQAIYTHGESSKSDSASVCILQIASQQTADILLTSVNDQSSNTAEGTVVVGSYKGMKY